MVSRKYNQDQIEKAFWEKVNIGGVHDCWEWTGSKTTVHHGEPYGIFRVHSKPILAHRFSYQLHFGPIPEGIQILHDCDNPLCINPKHLFEGTHTDNMRDMFLKGRNKCAIGEDVHTAILTEIQVLKIRNLYRTGLYTLIELGEMFRVDFRTIHYIVKRKTWRHVV